MNIVLPTQNLRTKKLLIRGGILYLRHGQSFRSTIYSLTYFMKGKHFCYYCKKRIPRNKITMDHMYPQSLGGPTIPQNLIPVCQECNSKKSNMTLDQYKTFLSLHTIPEKMAYKKRLTVYKDSLKAVGMFEVPYSWINPVEVSQIHTRIDLANISGSQCKRILSCYRKNHRLQELIILDRNMLALDGIHSLFVAKSCSIPIVSAIVLDNVEVR